MNFTASIIRITMLLCCLGCNDPRPIPPYDIIDVVPVGWRMTPDEVVLAATSYCENVGMTAHIRLGPPTIVVDEYEGQRFWSLGYHQHSKMPGDHFSILINDSTGEIEYEPGV